MHFFFIICSWKLIAKTLLWDFEQCSKSGGKGLINRRNPWPWYSLLPFESKRNSQKRVISLIRETLQGRSQGAPKVHDCAPPLWALSGPQTPRPIILDPPFLIPGYGPALVLNIAWKAHFRVYCRIGSISSILWQKCLQIIDWIFLAFIILTPFNCYGGAFCSFLNEWISRWYELLFIGASTKNRSRYSKVV